MRVVPSGGARAGVGLIVDRPGRRVTSGARGLGSLGRLGEAGVGVEVVGERAPAGPDLLAFVAFEAAAAHAVAALEVADAAFGAGSVALHSALGAARAELLAAGDEDALGCDLGEAVGGRCGVK